MKSLRWISTPRLTESLRAGSKLARVAVARIIHQQQQQNVPGLEEIPLEEPGRIMHQAESPFKSDLTRPAWRRRYNTRNVVERCSDRRQDHRRLQPGTIFLGPKLLPRHAHSYHQQIGPVGIDTLYQGLIVGTTVACVKISFAHFYLQR